MAGLEIIENGPGYFRRTVITGVSNESGRQTHELGRLSVRYEKSEEDGLRLTLAARLRGVYRGRIVVPVSGAGEGSISIGRHQINVYGFSQPKLV